VKSAQHGGGYREIDPFHDKKASMKAPDIWIRFIVELPRKTGFLLKSTKQSQQNTPNGASRSTSGHAMRFFVRLCKHTQPAAA
jgi:hypothetical protein